MAGVDEVVDFLEPLWNETLDGESWLYTLPLGSSWLGTDISYGPWPAASCAAVLRVWYEADLIRLHFRDQPEWNLIPSGWGARLVDDGTLADVDALELLDHPERWVQGHADGYVTPLRTWQGEVASAEQWVGAARETARHLPLRTLDQG